MFLISYFRFMISNSAKYAIKAIIYLGLHSSKSKKILTREMFDEIQVSESYLAKILQGISHCNLKNPCALHDTVGKGKTEFNRKLENALIKEVISKLKGKEVYYPL